MVFVGAFSCGSSFSRASPVDGGSVSSSSSATRAGTTGIASCSPPPTWVSITHHSWHRGVTSFTGLLTQDGTLGTTHLLYERHTSLQNLVFSFITDLKYIWLDLEELHFLSPPHPPLVLSFLLYMLHSSRNAAASAPPSHRAHPSPAADYIIQHTPFPLLLLPSLHVPIELKMQRRLFHRPRIPLCRCSSTKKVALMT